MLKTSPICLLCKASQTKSWLWNHRLSHLIFGTLNKLAKDGLAQLKVHKDHLCSACALGKSKKSSHQPKDEDSNQEKLYLLHMDLCRPMRVASIIEKRDYWDHLFQPMFDEYFNPPLILVSLVQEAAAPRVVVLADSHVLTSIDQDAPSTREQVDATLYGGMIGTHMYLISSRPDLVYVVCLCARYQENPTEKHLQAVIQIFRYLKGTINMGLCYSKDTGMSLTAYVDADHVGCQDIRRSTSGSA
nr:uncharacterized mitochondrial protein AtMg00810-like [Tanacetum cinerariifolium]